MRKTSSSPRRVPLISCRRSSVSLFVAILTPVLAAMSGLGIDVSNWTVEQMRVQRAADAAAISGMIVYKQSSNARAAATAAARIAEINGVAGTATPSWNDSTKTLTDNQIAVQIVNGIKNASDTAIKVTAQETVPLTLTRLVTSMTSVTVTATSYGELVNLAGNTPQPCLLALAGNDVGITTGTDVTFSGSITIDAPYCSVRSDAGISIGGNTTINTAGLYAGGTITISGNSAQITGPTYQDSGQISDPYSNNATLTAALSNANSASAAPLVCQNSGCTGPSNWGSCSASACTLNPGTYGGMTLNGSSTYTLSPGLYTVNGSISWGGSNTIVTGSNFTIVMGKGTSGSPYTLDTTGSSVLQLNAATSTSATTYGAIAGIMFATQSSGAIKLTGNSGVPLTGVVYAPNANLTFSGSSSQGSSGCAEVIASIIKITGSASLTSSGCASYGAANFASMPASYTARLVQ